MEKLQKESPEKLQSAKSLSNPLSDPKRPQGDFRCRVCNNWKFSNPRCNCKGKPAGDEKGASAYEAFLEALFQSFEAKPNTSFDDDKETNYNVNEPVQNKWDQPKFQPRPSEKLSIEELIKLLAKLLLLEINNDGSLTFRIQAGITALQLDAIKNFFVLLENNNEQAVDLFKKYLKNTKDISLDGYDIKLSVKNNVLTLTIPDPQKRQEFIEQLIQKNLLRPEPQSAVKPHQYVTPFNMTPCSMKLVPSSGSK